MRMLAGPTEHLKVAVLRKIKVVLVALPDACGLIASSKCNELYRAEGPLN